MSFTLVDSVNLIALLTFVWWEPSMPSRKDVAWYSQFRSEVSRINPPSWVFFPVWTVLKGLSVTGMLLFMKWSSEGPNGTGDWTYLAVYIVFIIHTLMKKAWTMLFFKMRLLGVSFVNVMTTCVTAILLVVFSALSGNNTGYLFPVIVSFFALELAWLLFAAVLAGSWWYTFRDPDAPVLSATFRITGGRRSRNKQEEP